MTAPELSPPGAQKLEVVMMSLFLRLVGPRRPKATEVGNWAPGVRILSRMVPGPPWRSGRMIRT